MHSNIWCVALEARMHIRAHSKRDLCEQTEQKVKEERNYSANSTLNLHRSAVI